VPYPDASRKWLVGGTRGPSDWRRRDNDNSRFYPRIGLLFYHRKRADGLTDAGDRPCETLGFPPSAQPGKPRRNDLDIDLVAAGLGFQSCRIPLKNSSKRMTSSIFRLTGRLAAGGRGWHLGADGRSAAVGNTSSQSHWDSR